MNAKTLGSYLLCALTVAGAQAAEWESQAAAPASLARHLGAYELDDGATLFVTWLADIGSLLFAEHPSGRVGPLLPEGPGRFAVGPSMKVREPVEATVTFSGDGVVWSGGRVTRAGRRLSLREEEVSFTSDGGLRFGATLTTPSGPGPFPAVVLLHGGGPQTRNFGWVAPFFARLGVAVLAYDKRGSGASGGDWRRASTRDLASDALAAVDWLRGRPEIDSRRIGFYGSSNGAWVAPLAASQAPDRIAFVIARSAPGWPERRNVIYEAETDLRAHGFGDEVVARVRALHEQDLALLDDGAAGWNDLHHALEKAAAEPWFPLSRLPRDIGELTDANRPNVERWLRDAKARIVDPAVVWRQVRCPVLVQNGDADEYVPGRDSVRIIETALREGSNTRHVVSLFPRGTHALFEGDGKRPPDYATVRRFVPGYLAELETWIRAHATAATEPPSVSEVLQRFETALQVFGSPARHESRIARAEYEEPSGAHGEVLEYALAPDRYLQVLILDDGTIVQRGSSGKQVWSARHQGPEVTPAETVPAVWRDGAFDRDRRLRELFADLHLVGAQTLDGEPTWLVEAFAPDGEREELHFSQARGLLVRRAYDYVFPDGRRQRREVAYEEYADFSGVRLPALVRQIRPAAALYRYTNISGNATIDEGRFEPPRCQ